MLLSAYVGRAKHAGMWSSYPSKCARASQTFQIIKLQKERDKVKETSNWTELNRHNLSYLTLGSVILKVKDRAPEDIYD